MTSTSMSMDHPDKRVSNSSKYANNNRNDRKYNNLELEK